MQVQRNDRKKQISQSPKYTPFDYHEVVQEPAASQIIAQEINIIDSVVFTDSPNLKVFCQDCRKQINKTTTILSEHSIYRCVGCFAKLQPIDAPYQVIKSLNFPLFAHNWKASHEILFLNFLQKYGFNNWADIGDQMDFYGTSFSIAELQHHYYQCYLANQEFLPKMLNNDNFFQKLQERPSNLKATVNYTQIKQLHRTYEVPEQLESYEDMDEYQVGQLVKARKEKHKQKEDYCGFYNEKRNEFDVEYDPQAELMLANLQFRDDDSGQEQIIKIQLIELYNQRMQKRNQLKNFVIQHRLLDQNYQKEKHRCRNQLEKQAFEQLKPIARFTTFSEYNQLIQKVAFTKQLKSIIEGLRKLRRTHPSSFNSLDDFLSNQPQESMPKKKVHSQSGARTDKKVEQMLQKSFHISKKQFQSIVSKLAANGKKAVYKHIEAVMLSHNYE